MVESIDVDLNEDMLILNKQFEAFKLLGGIGHKSGGHAISDGSFLPSGSSSDDNSDNSCSISDQDNNSTKKNASILHHLEDWVSTTKPSGKPYDFGSLISKEMLKYNLDERNAIYEEVHGVANLCPDESEPGMIEMALEELENELLFLPESQKSAFLQSQTLEKTYVNERDFRLRFLRADLFNARKAALRITMFLEAVLEIYGPYALERPVRLSDFSRKEMKVFNLGRIQLLPYRDRVGRRIIIGFPNQQHKHSQALIRAKIHVYLWWVASESAESQRKGVTFVVMHNADVAHEASMTSKKAKNCVGGDNVGKEEDQQENQQPEITGLPSMKFTKQFVTRRLGLPTRMVAFHVCSPDTPFYALMQTFIAAMMGVERCRTKFHSGEFMENLYKLSGYGIPLDHIPITESGKIKTVHSKKFLQLRRNLEHSDIEVREQFDSIVECPGSNDVVFRPSQSMMCHPGNVKFRSLVESKHFEHSIACSRAEKIVIAKGVIQQVKDSGGRFLVWDKHTWWKLLDDEKEIYAKTAIFFRNSKVSAKARTNLQTNKSSTFIFTGEAFESMGKRRKIEGDSDSNSDGSGERYTCICSV